MEEWLYRMMIKMHVRFYPIRSWGKHEKCAVRGIGRKINSFRAGKEFNSFLILNLEANNQIKDYPISLPPSLKKTFLAEKMPRYKMYSKMSRESL